MDSETGEALPQDSIVLRQEYFKSTDAETGETGRRKRRTTFQIPKKLLQFNGPDDDELLRCLYPTYDSLPLKKKKKNCCLQKVITHYQEMSPMVFMLPTLLFVSAWATVICLIIEICIHFVAHKKDRWRNKNSSHLSPLHSITAEFCAVCQANFRMRAIGKMQDERTLEQSNKRQLRCMEKVGIVS